MFDGEPYYLLNVCGVVDPQDIFPFAAVERRIAEGQFDTDPLIKVELQGCVLERRLPGDVVERVYCGERYRWYWPDNSNRLLVKKGFAADVNVFVIPTLHSHSHGVLTIFSGAAAGYQLVTETFKQAVKTAKLTGGHFEPCTEVD